MDLLIQRQLSRTEPQGGTRSLVTLENRAGFSVLRDLGMTIDTEEKLLLIESYLRRVCSLIGVPFLGCVVHAHHQINRDRLRSAEDKGGVELGEDDIMVREHGARLHEVCLCYRGVLHT